MFMEYYKCLICDHIFDNNNKFAKHRFHKHNLSLKEYYDKFLKKENDGICLVCCKETKFCKSSRSYSKTCSHKCGGILFRKNLKNNSEKFKNFQNKVSDHRKKWWNSLSEDELIKNSEKMKKGTIEYISKLSKEERKEKFGFLNKLDKKEKEKFIKEKMLNTGAHKWWKTATDDEKKKIYNKRRETNIKNNNLIDRKNLDIFQKFEIYKKEVQHRTNLTYRKHKKEIDFKKLRGRGYQLDHIFSISAGFKNKIDPKILSIKENLRILSSFENNSKNNRCDITKEELLLIYQENYEKNIRKEK